MEYHKGKLIKIEQLSGKSLVEVIDYLQENFDIIEVELEDDYFYSKEVVKLNDNYYKIEDEELDECYANMWLNAYGSIGYMNAFYNGGSHLHEVLEMGLNELE